MGKILGGVVSSVNSGGSENKWLVAAQRPAALWASVARHAAPGQRPAGSAACTCLELASATTLRLSRGPPTQRKLQRLAWRERPRRCRAVKLAPRDRATRAAGPGHSCRWRGSGAAASHAEALQGAAASLQQAARQCAASHEQAVAAQHARHLPVQRLEQIQLKVGQGLQFGSKRLEGWLHELALAGSAMRGALERDPVRGEEGGRAGGRRRAWHCCSCSAAGVDRRCCLRCIAIDWRGWSRPTHRCQLNNTTPQC